MNQDILLFIIGLVSLVFGIIMIWIIMYIFKKSKKEESRNRLILSGVSLFFIPGMILTGVAAILIGLNIIWGFGLEFIKKLF